MDPSDQPSLAEQSLRNASSPGFLGGLWDFLRTSGKWWMLPVLLIFLLLGVVLVLANTAAAPFIYTLF